eukprot:3538539-Ditylum_brightwellii.AAC.1
MALSWPPVTLSNFPWSLDAPMPRYSFGPHSTSLENVESREDLCNANDIDGHSICWHCSLDIVAARSGYSSPFRMVV